MIFIKMVAPSIKEMREQFRKRIYGQESKEMTELNSKPINVELSEVILEEHKKSIQGNLDPSYVITEKDFERQYQMIPRQLDDKCSNEGWIQTFSGRKFFPLNPREEDISLEDIAHALSRINRFTGHINKENYSVAEHSVLVSYFCNEEDKRHGLLHDSSEFSLTDLASPIKRSGKFEEYKKYEKILQSMIYKKFGLSEIEPDSVRNADLLMLSTEAVNLFDNMHPDWKLPCSPAPIKIQGLNPNAAKKLFLDRFYELFGK